MSDDDLELEDLGPSSDLVNIDIGDGSGKIHIGVDQHGHSWNVHVHPDEDFDDAVERGDYWRR